MNTARTINWINEHGHRLLAVSVSTLGILFCLYVYFLSMSVVHVVMREEVQQEVARLNTQISQLEARYISAQHKVSQQVAQLEGFAEVTDKVFIDRSDDTLVLSVSSR